MLFRNVGLSLLLFGVNSVHCWIPLKNAILLAFERIRWKRQISSEFHLNSKFIDNKFVTCCKSIFFGNVISVKEQVSERHSKHTCKWSRTFCLIHTSNVLGWDTYVHLRAMHDGWWKRVELFATTSLNVWNSLILTPIIQWETHRTDNTHINNTIIIEQHPQKRCRLFSKCLLLQWPNWKCCKRCDQATKEKKTKFVCFHFKFFITYFISIFNMCLLFVREIIYSFYFSNRFQIFPSKFIMLLLLQPFHLLQHFHFQFH